MTNRPYTDPGPIERGAYTLGVNGRSRFVGSIDGDTVRWGTDPGTPNRSSSTGDFKSWVYASRAVRWPGPYFQETAE